MKTNARMRGGGKGWIATLIAHDFWREDDVIFYFLFTAYINERLVSFLDKGNFTIR